MSRRAVTSTSMPLRLVLRAYVFKTLYYTWTGVLCIVLLWAFVLPIKPFRAVVRMWLHQLGWLERVVGGIRFRVVGMNNLPAEPCLIAAKHQSLWETFRLRLLLNDPAIVLKRELVRIPFWGWYLARSGVIPIDRRGDTKTVRAMHNAAKKAIAEGRHVLIFPEGTRRSPDSAGNYKSGVSLLYKALGVPLVPIALNSGVFWPRHTTVSLPGTITLEVLPPIPPKLPRVEMMQRLEESLENATSRLVAEARVSVRSVVEE